MNSEIKILKDGRKLSYCEFGNHNGEPIFYFHGFPGSHLELELWNGNKVANEYGLRIIAVNRPGYSHSDLHDSRSLLDWPDDIAELALSLTIDRFSVIGLSGGGPYAIACAYKIPTLLKKVGVRSGMGPIYAPGAKDVPSWSIIRWPGFLRKIMLLGMRNMVESNPKKFQYNMTKSIPEVDYIFIEKKEIQESLTIALKEAFRFGIKGAMLDAKIYKNDWKFELKDVNQQINLWHGEKDLTVKIETAKFLAYYLPNCKSKFYSNEGHFSLIGNYAGDILKEFVHNINDNQS